MNQFLKLPELILLDTLNKCIEFARRDYLSKSDKNDSYLGRILNGVNYGRYDFFTQAIEVFVNNDIGNPRYIQCNLMYNIERQGAPSIHISLPSETLQKGGNGIGLDQGYSEDIIDEIGGTDEPVYTRRYTSVYNIVITSDNSNEVIMMYHVIKSLLTSFTPSISIAGLENIEIGGKDLFINDKLVPLNIFMRTISIKLEYECSVPAVFTSPLINDIFYNGIVVNK